MPYIKRFVVLWVCALCLLELFFVVRIALINVMPMRSTAFERTAAVELLFEGKLGLWQQEWRGYDEIPENLKRAAIAAEDSHFMTHYGVEWQAILRAWQYNQRNRSVRGGSTITQQLAKNLFLSTEQTYLRKAQELVITFALEFLLSKQGVLELYLNHAEWGKGVYGAQAAIDHYFGGTRGNANLTERQAATLAAMLPQPKAYEANRNSSQFHRRVSSIMGGGIPVVEIP